jgi:hypothetical protein
MQERLESTRLGRVLISAFLIVTLLGLLTTSVLESHLRTKLLRVEHSFLYATGLTQNWGVFSPNPRRQVIELRARIVYGDGTTETWRPPRADPFIGAYWDFHWLKWVEYVILDDHRGDLWRPAATWIARAHATRDHRPVRVTLVRRWYDLPPPGHPAPHPWHEFAYYTLTVTPAVLDKAAP